MIETQSLKDPIDVQEVNVHNWLDSYISQENPQEDKAKWRAISKCALGALVLLRNICFIPLNFELPYGKYSGPFFAAGNIAALSGLDYWAGSRFIDSFLPKKTGIEKAFPKPEKPLHRRAADIAIFAPAFLSQIPAVYAGTQYNNPSLRLPIGIVVFLGGAVIPLRSIQLSLENYFNTVDAKKEGIDPAIQENFIKLLKENQQNFINMTPEEKKSFIAELENIRNTVNPSTRAEVYWNHLLPKKLSKNQMPPASKTVYASKSIGYFLSAIYQVATAIYTFEKTKELVWDNNYFAGVLASLVVGSSLYLTGSSIINSSEKLFHSITGINKEFYESEQTLANKLREKTVFRLNRIGDVTNVLALGVSYVIWKDFFQNKDERIFFESTMCLAVLLLLSASTPAVISDFVEGVLLPHTGTPEEKKAIKTSQEYQTLIDSAAKISPKNFQEFSRVIPSTTLNPTLNSAPASEDADKEISLQRIPADILNPLHDEENQNSFRIEREK